MKSITILILILYNFQLFAAQFVPVTMENQLLEADAVLHGIFQKSSSKKMPDNFIVTSHYFHLLEVAGINQNEIFNLDNFEVYTPGGTYNGRSVNVSGVPSFKKGEEVILLLKKNMYGWTIQNFALGKYNIEWVQDKKVLKSAVFPRHPRLGSISLDYFKSLVINELGQAMIKPSLDRYVDHGKNSLDKNNRQPASIKEKKKTAQSDLMWLGLLLGLLGSIMTWYHQRQASEES